MKEQKIEYDIIGMHCAACSARIENRLSKEEGIIDVAVNLALETGSVLYDSEKISPDKIADIVDKMGFQLIGKEEQEVSIDELREEEYLKQKRLFLFALVLSFPLFWTMVTHFSFSSSWWIPRILLNPKIQWILATPVQFIVGWQFYKGAYSSLKSKNANMDVLVSLGTSAAYFYSVYLTILNWNSSSHIHLYFETSAMLITLILLGKLLEQNAKGKTSSAIKKLIGLQSKTAVVERDGKEETISISDVVVGDILHVKPGEKIPVDAIVIYGNSAVDESMINGEPIPNDKEVGDFVIGSTVNKSGFLKIKAKKIGKDTMLSQIIETVKKAQSSKAPIQRIADKIAGIFVPVVMTIAAITFVAWYVWIDQGNFSRALENMISVLVIACPCSLGLATPTAIMAGSGRAAEYGVLFKGGEYLENAYRTNTIVLDKTGTITEGKPALSTVVIKNISEESFYQYVYSLEKCSEHPLAQAVVEGFEKSKKLDVIPLDDFENLSGYGVGGHVFGNEIWVGNRKLMLSKKIHFEEEDEILQLEETGKTLVFVAINGELSGYMAISDTIKESSKSSIEQLKNLGIDVIMMTGDHITAAREVASKVGIDTVIADVLPEEKADEIGKLQKQGKIVSMVGDGINDSPALATADVSMAIGTGTDIAMETADITLMRGDLESVYDALLLSKHTMRIIKQNLFWALCYNSIGIPLAASGCLLPWIAGAAMACSSVSVVTNSLRLQRIKLS